MQCGSCCRCAAQKCCAVVKKKESRHKVEKAVFRKSKDLIQGEAVPTNEMMHVMTGPLRPLPLSSVLPAVLGFPELAKSRQNTYHFRQYTQGACSSWQSRGFSSRHHDTSFTDVFILLVGTSSGDQVGRHAIRILHQFRSCQLGRSSPELFLTEPVPRCTAAPFLLLCGDWRLGSMPC